MIRSCCVVLVATTAFAACTGNGDPHHDHTLVRVDAEPQGANCQYGGTVIHTGVDTDQDDALDDSEITSSQYICDASSAVKCADGSAKLDGPVSVADASDFAALAGIACIDGDLVIVGTPLATFPETASLQIVTGSVIVAGNGSLVSLDGFPSLTQVGRRYVAQGNDALADVSALGNLQRFQSIAIVGNDALVDLAGLDTFTEIDGGLQISNNSALTSLHGLENLTRGLREAIIVRSNKNLVSTAALSNLRSAVLLEVTGNASLTSLQLPALEKVDVYISVGTNAALTSVNMQSLFTVGGGLVFQNNPALTSLSFPELVLVGGMQIESHPSLASISAPALAYTTAGFDLVNLPQLASADFSDLTAIGGRLYLYLLPQLADLTGFTALASIGGDLSVRACNGLDDFTGLTSLVDVANMTVHENAQLTSFSGLSSFSKVGGDLIIVNNPNLPLSAAQAFANAITVVGTTTID